MLVPLAASFLLALKISPSCFAHWLSLSTWDPVHLICRDPDYAYIRYVCTSWVTLIGISFSAATAQSVLSYYYGRRIVGWIYGYQEIGEEELGNLSDGFEEMLEKAGIDHVCVFLLETSEPKMFSFRGHGDPCIFVSVGLLETLSDPEILAAMGHEIAHISNNDTLLRSVASGLKVASLFNLMGFFVEPVLSRDREFMADAEGATLSGRPRALISALTKLYQVSDSGLDGLLLGTLSLSLFAPGETILRLLSRHPPLEERVKRLMELTKNNPALC